MGYLLRLLPVGIGMGIFQSPNNSAIMGSLPREQLGIASSMLSISRVLGQTTGTAILGAVWASRVIVHNGSIPPGGATTAPIAAQVTGLQDTFWVVIIMIALGLILSIWSLVQARRLRQQATVTQLSSG